MTIFSAQLLSVVASYLIGAIPFGLIFTRYFSGIDVRTIGSGNIGATNVLRASGKKAAIFTLLADGLKGFLPVLIVQSLFNADGTTALVGAATVLGHNFPVYLKLKGGKGVATSFGVILAVAPLIGLSCLIIWLLAAFFWKYSSLSALIAFACYPLITFSTSFGTRKPLAALSLFIFGMMYYRHRENIKRLIAGTESKIGQK
ncbi:MAG TPA: glycerol-3-phosphate 1-O-acyltransferase PlsY [Nitrospirota bacterium]|nr:glycerol-3-phosphate 1-O-acyltransferase PlsY [Nitrospirota bacterium]